MIQYQVWPADPNGHYFDVQINATLSQTADQVIGTQSGLPAQQTSFRLPAWIPGSYMIREFARHIGPVKISVDGKSVSAKKIDKHSWAIAHNRGQVQINYRVYAWDLSVRAAHLDGTHGFFNGSSLFLQIAGFEQTPCQLAIHAPASIDVWKVATTLPVKKVNRQGFGLYQTQTYDELIDHPVEMGQFVQTQFKACGIVHRAVFTGETDVDLKRVASDLEKICTAQIALFEPRTKRAPFPEYLFMTQVVGDGYGGLEHRASTALICSRNDLPHKAMKKMSAGYKQFLGLCSHEYFHSWNVKRIKPAAFTPYDLTRENYTELLWIFEGFTSYYDDLILRRAGLIDTESYLDCIAQTLNRVLNEPGRLQQSVAQSSFDAWVKYYRQDENCLNHIVSYYTKGSLVALCLDLSIRVQTQNKRSLDDVMRALWRLDHGLAESEFASIVLQATGVDLSAQIKRWAYGTQDLPVRELLVQAGIEWQQGTSDAPDFGAKLAQNGSDLVVQSVRNQSSAHHSGLSALDTIVAADGLKMTHAGFQALMARKQAGDWLELHAFRRDELMQFKAKLKAGALGAIKLRVPAKVTKTQATTLKRWLG
jgi:predicted metalloprotease with PDZ domain